MRLRATASSTILLLATVVESICADELDEPLPVIDLGYVSEYNPRYAISLLLTHPGTSSGLVVQRHFGSLPVPEHSLRAGSNWSTKVSRSHNPRNRSSCHPQWIRVEKLSAGDARVAGQIIRSDD
jgi:hypothetical protein